MKLTWPICFPDTLIPLYPALLLFFTQPTSVSLTNNECHYVYDKDKILKATREKWQIRYRELPSGYQLISQQKLYKPEENGMIYLTDEREEPTTKNTLPSKTLIQIWWRNQKFSRQAKVKIIQHHQTSFTTNSKGTLGRKQDKEKTYRK